MVELIPNILTFSRLGLTAIFLTMVLYIPYIENKPLFLDVAFVLFVIAGITDVVDGHIARKLGVTSKFGRMSDPLVDKTLICGAFICFAVIGEPKLFDLNSATLAVIHWLVVGILVLREAYVTMLRHIAEARGINFASVLSGKIKTFIQVFATGTVIIKMAHVQTAIWGYWFTTVTFVIMILVTAYSGVVYQIRWRKCSS
jgi:CDP-diacylglycerol--glycerol-3-phosphate 3-phosphatidyltransferase